MSETVLVNIDQTTNETANVQRLMKPTRFSAFKRFICSPFHRETNPNPNTNTDETVP